MLCQPDRPTLHTGRPIKACRERMLPSAKDSGLESRHRPKKDSTSHQNHQIQTLSDRASDVCASISL